MDNDPFRDDTPSKDTLHSAARDALYSGNRHPLRARLQAPDAGHESPLSADLQDLDLPGWAAIRDALYAGAVPPRAGDKMSSRSGNKSIVALMSRSDSANEESADSDALGQAAVSLTENAWRLNAAHEEQLRSLEDVIQGLQKTQVALLARVEESASLLRMVDLVEAVRGGELAVLLLEGAEPRHLEHVCAALCLRPTLLKATIRTKVTSRYTVTKDCGVDEVGWGDPDGDWELSASASRSKRLLTPAGEVDFDDCLTSRGIDRLKVDDLDIGEVDYDGDHHGVWAHADATASVLVLTKVTPSIYVSFTRVWDPAFQQTELRLHFQAELDLQGEGSEENQVDVTCIATDEPQPYEGVILPANGPPHYGNAEDVEDTWPDDGDFFWSWDDLAAEFAESVQRIPLNP